MCSPLCSLLCGATLLPSTRPRRRQAQWPVLPSAFSPALSASPGGRVFALPPSYCCLTVVWTKAVDSLESARAHLSKAAVPTLSTGAWFR